MSLISLKSDTRDNDLLSFVYNIYIQTFLSVNLILNMNLKHSLGKYNY